MASFTRDDIQAWQLSALTDWASALGSGIETVERELDTAQRHFDDIHDDWKGLAYEAARDHVATDTASGHKVNHEVSDLQTAATNAVSMLGSRRDVLLNKVSDAEHDGCTVTSGWKVDKPVPAGATQQQATDIANTIRNHQDAIDGAVSALKDEIDTTSRAIDDAAQRVRIRGDEAGDDDLAALDKPAEQDAGRIGEEDGKALAAEMAKPADQRDPAVMARIASQLPTHILTDAELRDLAAGKEVSTVPAAVQEYYRDLYKTAGADGILGLNEYLKGQAAGGNPNAGLQGASLANGFAMISDEKAGTGRDASGKLTGAGGYQYVPKSMQQLIEQRPGDGTMYPEYQGTPQTGPVPLPHSQHGPQAMPADGPYPGLPNPAKEQYLQQLGQFKDLMGQANPGYTPGTELGTKLYEKAADMAAHPDLTNTNVSGKDLDKTAGGFADFAGRNHEAAYKIWSGDGMPPGYHHDDTVRALLGHNWESSDGGAGASSLLKWIGTDAGLPPGDAMGQHARNALADMPRMLGGNDPSGEVWKHTQDAFMHSPKLSNAMTDVLTGNISALAPDSPAGWSKESMAFNGEHPVLNVSEGRRMMELGAYTDEGRTALEAAAEKHRADSLTQVFQQHPGEKLTDPLTQSGGGNFAGRVDNAVREAIDNQNTAGHNKIEHPDDEMTRLKLVGSKMAGSVVDMAVDKGLGSSPLGKAGDMLLGATGIKPGELATEQVQKWLNMPEYHDIPQKYEPDQLSARTNDAIANTVLKSAYAAGVPLPQDLVPNGQPIDLAGREPNGPVDTAWRQFVDNHGLGQYLNNYQQSYDGTRSQEGKGH